MDEPSDGTLEWETLGSERVYTCPGFDVVRDDVRLPDGTETSFHHVSEAPSVVVLPLTPDGDVVVIREWRQAVRRVNYGLPAGGMEGGEDVRVAAHRELREETGYEAEVIERLGASEPSNGLFGSVFHYVVARECRPSAEQQLDDNESIAVETTTLSELHDRAAAGKLRDGRSALAVLQYEAQKGNG